MGINSVKHKTCKVHQVNTIDHPEKFHLQKHKIGFYYICRQCHYIKRRETYLKNKDHELKLMKEWRKKNPERWKIINKEQSSKHYHKYKDVEEYKIKRKEIRRKWKVKNREKYRKLRQGYQKRRMARDPGYKIQERLRTRVSCLMRKINTAKSATTLNMLGCSREELKNYIEKKFEDGMNWNNYGVWHVDHIIPCARFDLTDPEQQKICFHHTNLQPMWGEQNVKKGGRLC